MRNASFCSVETHRASEFWIKKSCRALFTNIRRHSFPDAQASPLQRAGAPTPKPKRSAKPAAVNLKVPDLIPAVQAL
jgi:hypothetical protein